jgi:hypothetical protein
MFDFLKRKPKQVEVKEEKPKTHKIKTKTPKEKATEAGEPYVSVVQVELDPDDVGNGAFELDWNDIFVARLIKAGFKGKDDAQIVDQWFQSICRNILNENFEQWEANQPVDTRPRRVDRNDLGNGRTEVS